MIEIWTNIHQCELQDQEKEGFSNVTFSQLFLPTMAQNFSINELRDSTYEHTPWNCLFREIIDISFI